MYLKYRPVRLQDLPECAQCVRDRFAYSADALQDLQKLWATLLNENAASAMVIENLEAAQGQRIVWFCIKGFVPDPYVRYLKSDAPPILARHIMELCSLNKSPLLTFSQIRKANSKGGAGLNIIVLNSGSPAHVFENGMWTLIAGKVVEFTPLCAGGYQLNELLIEVYDEFTYAWVEGMGMQLRTDYSGRVDRLTRAARLYGITQREANAAVGTSFSAIFHRQWPRYYFTPAEQELLQWALFGESDASLASSLSISAASVRKRWEGIYDKVSSITPELFVDEFAPSEGHRSEKKRHLLGYLRHHLEELRPVVPG